MNKQINLNEIDTLLYGLSTNDERNAFYRQRTEDVIKKFDKLYESLKLTIQDRDAEYADAIELLIKETDKRVRSYLANLQKNADSKLEDVNSLITRLEDKLSSSDSEVRNQLKEAKSAILDFNSKLSKAHKEIESLVNKSFAAYDKLDNKTELINKEIDSLKKDLISRFSDAMSHKGGGSMNRQIRIDGTNYLTRYTDINLKAGSGMTLAAANDDVNKRVNITFTSTGGGGSGVSVANLSAQLDSENPGIYTVPANTAFVALFGSNSPFTYAPTQYSGSGTTTLTLDTTKVNAPAIGNLILLYTP